jgi:hypothetical protein
MSLFGVVWIALAQSEGTSELQVGATARPLSLFALVIPSAESNCCLCSTLDPIYVEAQRDGSHVKLGVSFMIPAMWSWTLDLMWLSPSRLIC